MKHLLLLFAVSLCVCSPLPLAAQEDAPDAPAAYPDIIRSAGDAVLKEAREKLEADIAEAQAEVEAASAPAEEE